MKVEELRAMAATLADVLPIEILPEIDRRELASHMTLRKFKQDEVVYHQGDPAAHWFVVFEGLIKVLLLDENGRELLISLHSRGEFFGELVIFEDSSHMAFVEEREAYVATVREFLTKVESGSEKTAGRPA